MAVPDRLRELLSNLWTLDWTCPRCGRPFNDKRQIHTCGDHTVRQYLEGHSSASVELYRRFAEHVRECGPIIVVPERQRVMFQTRLVFAGVVRLSDGGLEGYLVLRRRVASTCFSKIETVSALEHLHHFLVRTTDDLDDELTAWLTEAYIAASADRPASAERPS
jgi:hypothetical protein